MQHVDLLVSELMSKRKRPSRGTDCTLYNIAKGGFRARMSEDKKGAGAQKIVSNAETKA
jgi:hypothetical protein